MLRILEKKVLIKKKIASLFFQMGAVVNEEAFCLKWNDFHTSLTSSFLELRAESDLLDVTIVCEGQAVKAHRLVLSGSSGVFRQMFRTNGGLVNKTEPVIMMWDVKADDLKLLINFMYEGQVNVSQENLQTFLALAEKLQVRGLTTTTMNGSRTSIVSTTSSESRRPSTTRYQNLKIKLLNLQQLTLFTFILNFL